METAPPDASFITGFTTAPPPVPADTEQRGEIPNKTRVIAAGTARLTPPAIPTDGRRPV
ncbi:hypothetical protein Ssi02_76180 [Sinosporangium siamense]|uniref:Uncharacterized protein n=1 Tax=Sinosporangium siamense TaxID=1367973 RepID=A0A919RP77_9ACTN|nr:hypothetical protein Ssi02_76180 [Sinosporangium siamense]